MLQNSRGINPLNWQLLIDETLRRRKAEKITQREHAALAGVSVPTMADFERGEVTLTLVKAFDILRVVGLIEELKEEDAQDKFIKKSFTRWQQLCSQLPNNSHYRFPHGWYQFDYYFEGNLKTVDLKLFKANLEQANKPAYTGHPPFLFSNRQSTRFTPDENEGEFECWLKPDEKNPFLPGDYWRASPTGHMFLIQGYEEDFAETFPAGSVFDSILPIWRMGEILLHAERLASFLQKNPNSPITIHFRVIYSGLSGRVVRSWSNPLNSIYFEEGSGAAKSNEAILQAIVPAKDIPSRLADYIYPLVSSLYERFGITELSQDFVKKEVERLSKGRNKYSW